MSLHFSVGDCVIERTGEGCHSQRRQTTVDTVDGNACRVACSSQWYDRLTGRRIPHNEGRYRAIHTAGYTASGKPQPPVGL